MVDFVVSEGHIVSEDTIGKLKSNSLGPRPDLKRDEDLDIADFVVFVAFDPFLVADPVVDNDLQ
jgi:hypothetical protein